MERVETSLIIGRGEIGKALYKFLTEKNAKVYIRDVKATKTPPIDVLHIAFPYSPDFVKHVQNYIEQYGPEIVVVYSTVPVGTCEAISNTVVHSPVEGRHPHLASSFSLGVRWLGCGNNLALADAVMFWKPYVGVIRTVNSPQATEFMKLRSTAKFGINLVFADYEAQVAKQLKIDHAAIRQFDEDYNDLYHALGYEQFKRYVLMPPKGKIGGHCVVPNAELLYQQFPHEMLKMIMAMSPPLTKGKGKK